MDTAPATIDDYIAAFPAPVRAVLRRIRATIRRCAPGATETISYRMPAFRARGVLLWFAAFQRHIGLFPPVRGDAAIERAVRPYAGPKGNLRFPLDAPIPYELIARIARLRVAQDAAKTTGGAKRTDRSRPGAAKRRRRA